MRQSFFSRALVVLTLLATLSQVSRAQYDAPTSYYNAATGTGATLLSQLRTIISVMDTVSYGDARYSAPYTDPDPNVPGNILLIYNRASVGEEWVTSPALVWNREHIWPQSRLGTASDSDQFNLRPANETINSTRGNRPFGLDTNTGNHGTVGATYYYPGDADAGDVARAQFYMATRWNGLTLTDGSPSGSQMGDLSSLMNYHFRDVPDTFERRRNHAIYGLAGAPGSPAITNPYNQANRNPFVDHPEWAWSVFMDQQNDSQLYVGTTPDANGHSAVDLNLGSVLVGAPVPSAQNITLNKNGDDGTYYEVTVGGSATSSVTGKLNAFPVVTGPSIPKTKTLTVGLNTNTASAGLKSGTVTVNNLDITTAGGSGKGSNDANDTINVSLDVLSHANPSFSTESDQNSLTYDFGTVTLGSTVTAYEFDIANLVDTAGFTAKLDLDSIISTGDFATLSTDLSVFNGSSALSAGLSNSFEASIDTSVEGTFSAMYTLSFSDEDLPGAVGLGSLTLNLSAIVEAPAFVDTADFDGDGDVDGRDFLIWQNGFGIGTTLETGDANNSGAVDGEDLIVWQEQYGQLLGGLSAAQSVPEPTSAVLLLFSSAWVFGVCRRG